MSERGSRRGHPTFIEKVGNALLQIFVGLPLSALLWLFAMALKALYWLKGKRP
jgi:hypothetical protein